jgi:hypothetical protein
MKFVFSGPILEKYSSIKEGENQSSGCKVVPWGRVNTQTDWQTDEQIDMVKLITDFRNLANAPKNNSL